MITLAPVRADTLPENTNYRDDGCNVSSTCLACPLPVCKFDDPGWVHRASRHRRDRTIVRTGRTEGLSVNELAERFGVSTRTIHRILQSERSGALDRQRVIPESPVAHLRGRRYFRLPDPLPPIRESPSASGGYLPSAAGF